MFITLTTDFGLKDPFVGIMKGVIARINPSATVIDLTHGIPPQDILAGALALRHASRYFPPGTIHVVVVDPGVGGSRRPLLIELEDAALVGPDNGVLSLACEEHRRRRVIHLSNPAYHLMPSSGTFHGRDIFAPVAAYLSLGVAAVAFGESIDDYIRLVQPQPMVGGQAVTGEIVYIDHFGNLFTNIEARDVDGLGTGSFSVSLGELRIGPLSASYAAVEKGQPVAVINSWGVLELALNQGNAARRFGAHLGDRVRVSAGGHHE